MGLSSALYSGTSGLSANGEKMSVIGNNLANVNTVGFKKTRMHFEDALSQTITTANGPGQVGRGVNVGAVMSDFSQGSIENTNESTDLSIGGEGFFVVSPKGEERNLYTRAGNFRFDEDGFLVDPHGYVVQGWRVQQQDDVAATTGATATEATSVDIEGVPRDIQLENFQSPPQETTEVNMVVNLDSRSDQGSMNATTPFRALFDQWDATNDEPIGDSQYAYQSTLRTYDQNGTAHNLTVYFDPIPSDNINNVGGDEYWEYLVTVPPDEDNRQFWDDWVSAGNTADKKGILMSGTLKFNSSGQLDNMSAYTIRENADGSDPNAYSSWSTTELSDGLPIVTPNFRGDADADYTEQTDPGENARNIAIDFGIRSETGAWTAVDTDSDGIITLNDIDDNDALNIPGLQGEETQALSTTSFSTGSTTVTQSQDGYTAGFLQNISVDRDGVLTGSFSNGQQLDLYVTTLADFNNTQGLNREGGNLFSETRTSGPPLTGLPGTGSLGTIASNSLEQSNVDISEEFVKMIITEKGFQANSRTITTTDTMLQEVINLKR